MCFAGCTSIMLKYYYPNLTKLLCNSVTLTSLFSSVDPDTLIFHFLYVLEINAFLVN
jgi:hypothetical protein